MGSTQGDEWRSVEQTPLTLWTCHAANTVANVVVLIASQLHIVYTFSLKLVIVYLKWANILKIGCIWSIKGEQSKLIRTMKFSKWLSPDR